MKQCKRSAFQLKRMEPIEEKWSLCRFIKESKEIHPENDYDYSLNIDSMVVSSDSLVIIVCGQCEYRWIEKVCDHLTRTNQPGHTCKIGLKAEVSRRLLLHRYKRLHNLPPEELIAFFRDHHLISAKGGKIGSGRTLKEFLQWRRQVLNEQNPLMSEKKWGTLIVDGKIFDRIKTWEGSFLLGYSIPE